ncbi:hypothetical protein GW17_00045909 [Ensete ventricosum]|nr:hypothetical protein GW17_00045909 [Ensete ventricosum]
MIGEREISNTELVTTPFHRSALRRASIGSDSQSDPNPIILLIGSPGTFESGFGLSGIINTPVNITAEEEGHRSFNKEEEKSTVRVEFIYPSTQVLLLLLLSSNSLGGRAFWIRISCRFLGSRPRGIRLAARRWAFTLTHTKGVRKTRSAHFGDAPRGLAVMT